MGADARRARGFRERPGYARGAPARRLRPFGHGPAPAGQLARHRDVGHAALLARIVHGAAPVDEPPHARVGVSPGRCVDYLPLGQVFRRPRRSLVVPGGFDEQLSQVLVAGLGYPAAESGLAAGVLGGHEPHPRREARRRGEPREAVGLAGDRDRGDGVDVLTLV